MERSSILLYVAPQRQLETNKRFRDFYQINFLIDIGWVRLHISVLKAIISSFRPYITSLLHIVEFMIKLTLDYIDDHFL